MRKQLRILSSIIMLALIADAVHAQKASEGRAVVSHGFENSDSIRFDWRAQYNTGQYLKYTRKIFDHLQPIGSVVQHRPITLWEPIIGYCRDTKGMIHYITRDPNETQPEPGLFEYLKKAMTDEEMQCKSSH